MSKNLRPNPPCRECKKRCELCHAHCREYLEFRKELDEYNKICKAKERNLFI